MKDRKRIAWLGINSCRLLLALTFVFSGVVKLIDPRGTQYKIEDYTVAFGLSDYMPHALPLMLAVALALLEFYLGFNLLFGIRRRTTTRMALALLLVMTPITLYLALTNAVSDCGCFGDALRLTHWQTFAKNVVLLLASVVVVLRYRQLTRFITERNQWMLSLYALVFAFSLAMYCIHYLPVMDFRPYRIGTDLPKAIERDFSGETETPVYLDFIIQSMDGEDITLTWLEQPGYKFLLVAPRLEDADDSAMDQINSIYDYCQQQGYPFLAVTSSMDESIARWKDLTGAEYDFARADGVLLKTMIRSNPGLILFHDGVIYNKWPNTRLPQPERLVEPLEQMKLGQMQERSRMRSVYHLLLWFILPLLLWTLIDRIWVGSKLYKRYKIHKELNKN